ncbi:MAG TPA: hypothetical protein VFI39_00725 [Gemmatimonadales bacterium]|nr:hypothetical protein [Gemmatimonadales bacterium]
MHRKLVPLTLATLLAVAPLTAQQLSITPFVGSIIPLKTMIIDTAGGTYYRATAHTTYGLRISRSMSSALSLQLQAGIGRGQFEAIGGTSVIELASSVYFADLRVRFRIVGSDATNLGIIGGAGWTQFSNGLFDTAHAEDSGTDLAGRVTGIVGLGVKAHLTGNASFTADLTDRIHEQSIDATSLGSGVIKPTQHDLAMSFGLNFPFGK